MFVFFFFYGNIRACKNISTLLNERKNILDKYLFPYFESTYVSIKYISSAHICQYQSLPIFHSQFPRKFPIFVFLHKLKVIK